MKTSEQISQELERAKKLVQSLEQKLEAQKQSVATLAQRREQVVLAAHGEGNQQAKDELEKAYTAALEATLKAQDLENAVATGREKYQALQNELDKTIQQKKRHAALQMAEAVLVEAEQIDKHMEAFFQLLAGHQQKIIELQQMGTSSGWAIFGSMGVRHVYRRLDALLYITTHGQAGNRQSGKVYSELTYAAIVQSQIDNNQKIQTSDQAA